MEVWVKPDSGQIMAFYTATTKSSVWKEKGYKKYVLKGKPTFPISRNHKVIIKKGQIINTVPNVNLIQPEPPKRTYPSELRVTGDDGTIYSIKIKNGKLMVDKI